MATLQSRKRKSAELDEEQNAQAATPTSSPVHKKMKITQAQKQALIDNLQLEITERARHLRAHYALQCSDLRSRIERRINRIPMSLRKAKMGDLLVKHSQPTAKPTAGQATQQAVSQSGSSTVASPPKNRPLPALPELSLTKPPSPMRPQASPLRPHLTRTSSTVFHVASEKENDTLPNPKNTKRVKASRAPVARVTSRANKAVLSPKSHNSRTLPRSPIKDQPATDACNSPSKMNPYIARPTSPLKPASPLKYAASAATSALSASLHGMVEHAKRGTAATARGLARTASKEKNIAAAIGANKKPMGPPPRPASARVRQASQARKTQETSASASVSASDSSRTTSQASNHTDTSLLSTGTTVVNTTRKGAGAGAGTRSVSSATATVKVSVEQKKTVVAAAKSGTVAKKTAATRANGKKVLVAEPAVGKRVLRKRN